MQIKRLGLTERKRQPVQRLTSNHVVLVRVIIALLIKYQIHVNIFFSLQRCQPKAPTPSVLYQPSSSSICAIHVKSTGTKRLTNSGDFLAAPGNASANVNKSSKPVCLTPSHHHNVNPTQDVRGRVRKQKETVIPSSNSSFPINSTTNGTSGFRTCFNIFGAHSAISTKHPRPSFNFSSLSFRVGRTCRSIVLKEVLLQYKDEQTGTHMEHLAN